MGHVSKCFTSNLDQDNNYNYALMLYERRAGGEGGSVAYKLNSTIRDGETACMMRSRS